MFFSPHGEKSVSPRKNSKTWKTCTCRRVGSWPFWCCSSFFLDPSRWWTCCWVSWWRLGSVHDLSGWSLVAQRGQAIKTVSTIEREQLEVDFAKKCLWEMIDKGLGQDCARGWKNSRRFIVVQSFCWSIGYDISWPHPVPRIWNPSCATGHADQDGDNRISEEEYRNVLRTPQASRWFHGIEEDRIEIYSSIGWGDSDEVEHDDNSPKAMAALTSLGVDVEAALDYGLLSCG